MSNCTCTDCLARHARMKDAELWNAYAEGRKDEREALHTEKDPVKRLKALIEAARDYANEIDNAGVLSMVWDVSEKLSEAVAACDDIGTRDHAAEALDWYESGREAA